MQMSAELEDSQLIEEVGRVISCPRRAAGKGAAYEVAVARAVGSAAGVVLLNIDPEDPAESIVTVRVLCPDHTMLITGSWNP